jgi:hypothetical protein
MAIPPIKVCQILNVLWKGPCRNVGELSFYQVVMGLIKAYSKTQLVAPITDLC